MKRNDWTKRLPARPRWQLATLLLVLMLATAPSFAQQSVSHPDLVVARPVIDMHRHPSGDSDVVSQAIYGTGVTELASQNGWYNIRTADNYTGWVSADAVIDIHKTTYTPDAKTIQVAELSANVYRDPDVTKHAPVLRLPWEARLELAPDQTGKTGRWIHVRLVDGNTGWVQRGDITTDSAPLSIPQDINLARRFLGTTYTWGGVSSFGFDCSGFTQMLERQRGIEMPRDAGLQADWSRVVPVKRADLQPGDLLFFGSSPSKITHTGMYIGNGKFIHDTTHDHPGVQISVLDDQPWTRLLVAARRIK
jgi:gamma-D-glutamyl-L-lysine dipeptidyl-peptidase